MTNKEYNHIFFDLDHTLWDFDSNSKEALHDIFHKYQIGERSEKDFDTFIQKYVHYNRMLWADYELGKIGKDDLRVNRFHFTLLSIGLNNLETAIKMGDEYVKVSPYKTGLIPYTIEVLDYLHKKKYHLHLITNGFEEVQHIKIEKSGLKHFFKSVITSEQAGSKKPSIGIFHFAFDVSGAKSYNSIMIGDSFHSDIVGAMAVGMDQVYFNPESEKHNKKPTFEISCLSDLKRIL